MAQRRTLKDTSRDPLAKEAFIQGEKKERKAIDLPMLNTRVEPELIKRIKICCANKEMTMKGFIIQAIEDKLKKFGF